MTDQQYVLGFDGIDDYVEVKDPFDNNIAFTISLWMKPSRLSDGGWHGFLGSKIKLKSWKGDYLHRPDSAQGVTTWSTGIGNEWMVDVKIWSACRSVRRNRGNNEQ